MRREFVLWKSGRWQLSAVPSAPVGWLALWIIFSMLGAAVLKLPTGEAVIGGALAAAVHVLSETVHQLGHAWAARRTGWPMSGLRYWGVLGASVYPADEPDLPSAIHLRRALGGPLASLSLGATAAIVARLLWPAAGLAFWLAAFTALDNLLVLGLGAFLPLGFTDGSTILKYARFRSGGRHD